MNELAKENLYQMIVDQNPERRSETRKACDEYELLINQAKADIRIDGLDLDTVAKFIVDAGWRPKAVQDERLTQANEACNAWIERANTAPHRKPVTSFDWELAQAIIHLKNAISVTDSHRAHLLQTALNITKGVRESD
jgi:hypothetical protein